MIRNDEDPNKQLQHVHMHVQHNNHPHQVWSGNDAQETGGILTQRVLSSSSKRSRATVSQQRDSDDNDDDSLRKQQARRSQRQQPQVSAVNDDVDVNVPVPPPPPVVEPSSPSPPSVFPFSFVPLKPVFSIRPLSLDRGAIAPALSRPTAPFATSERKKAYVSAIYYSECFLRNIQPKDADTAALAIQNQYDKWWIHSKSNHSKLTKKHPVQQPQAAAAAEKEYHSDATKKRRRVDATTTTATTMGELLLSSSSSSLESQTPLLTDEEVALVKDGLIAHLQKTGGDTSTTDFRRHLEQLQSVYAFRQRQRTSSTTPTTMEEEQDGTWLTLSKPTFSECQGRNEQGECLYTLGRMSFDMFRPTHLKCSIRAVMNNIRVMDPKSKPQSFPSRLGKEIMRQNKIHNNSDNNNKRPPIRHYDIVVAFTIEANQTRDGNNVVGGGDDRNDFVIPRPIRGLMTNHGYMVADPTEPNRSTIWFSAGSIEVQDEVADGGIWKQIFDESLAPRRDMRAMANVLAAKLLLGAYTTTTTSTSNTNNNDNSNGDDIPTMSYLFKRPIGGHGEVYCDALYMDETLRIMQGHRGSIFVFTRVPTFQEDD